MKVIAFSNQKGGVGKTTSAINVGAGLAKKREISFTEINSDLAIKGVFFTKHNPRKILTRDVEESIRNAHTTQVLNTFIRENVALEESPYANLDIFRYAPNSNGAVDYENLVNEILIK